jgi:hypothetical protein
MSSGVKKRYLNFGLNLKLLFGSELSFMREKKRSAVSSLTVLPISFSEDS